MIERIPFGSTGHDSSRALFGAAALGAMKPERAARTLERVFEAGVNHIDVAASYGDAELRLAPWLAEHRREVFLATKTGERSAEGARESLHRSLERMGVDHIDMIQLHNLVDPAEWERALGPDGALEALVEAREQGLVSFLGVTGHGTRTAEMHRRSLERFPFDSVLLPYSHTLMADAQYAADFEQLLTLCAERRVAVQTIKSVARRRWPDGATDPRFSWYEPLRDPEAIRRAVHFVLSRPGLFLNTSSDATILPLILDAADSGGGEVTSAPSSALLAGDAERFGIEPIFVRGASDAI